MTVTRSGGVANHGCIHEENCETYKRNRGTDKGVQLVGSVCTKKGYSSVGRAGDKLSVSQVRFLLFHYPGRGYICLNPYGGQHRYNKMLVEDKEMKDIETILKDAGIDAEKAKDIVAEVNKNYRTVTDYEKQTKKLERAEADRDSQKERADLAEETLKGFDGKDFEAITRERDEWKKKAEDAEKEYSAKEAEREKQELLKEAFADIEFTSESAKKAIMAQIAEGVTVKNGKLIGFNDLLEDAKKSDASAFVDKEQQNLEANKARFTTSMNNQNGGKNFGKMTREDIGKIKDAGERQKAIAENLDLYQ